LLIVGGGVGYNEVVRLAKEYSISTDVVFTGTIPYSIVPNYISCMDVGVIPFKLDKVSQDSLPLKLFEYMACETPVIATNVKGVIESVGDLVLYASDSEDYSKKITALYNDEELKRKMGLMGRKFVEENYDWSKVSSDLEKVLRDTEDM
jgi:glycosyltransferase involved in cell wall biosynthesis